MSTARSAHGRVLSGALKVLSTNNPWRRKGLITARKTRRSSSTRRGPETEHSAHEMRSIHTMTIKASTRKRATQVSIATQRQWRETRHTTAQRGSKYRANNQAEDRPARRSQCSMRRTFCGTSLRYTRIAARLRAAHHDNHTAYVRCVPWQTCHQRGASETIALRNFSAAGWAGPRVEVGVG